MPDINPSIPVVGQPDSTEEPKIVTALQSIVSTINALDTDNIVAGAITTALLADSAATSRKLSPTISLATRDSTGVAIGTSYTDITDVTMTFTPAIAGRSIFIGMASGGMGNTGAATSAATVEMQLAVDGVGEAFTPIVQWANSGGAVSALTQPFTLLGVWVPTLTAASHTAKLQAIRAGTASSTTTVFSSFLARVELGA